MKILPDYQFCFDLQPDKVLQHYLPTAYIVDYLETIVYVDKKASPEVLQSMHIFPEDLAPNIQKILSICNQLRPENIFKKFSTKLKKAKTIADLLQDPKIALGINVHLTNNLNTFYTLINLEKLPLSIGLDREKDFQKNQITTNNNPLHTKLHFDKHPQGITYTLKLQNELADFYPSNCKVIFLLNSPSWLLIDNKLVQLQDVNANKLKPFLIKKEVEIPEKMIVDYFSKFINDMAKKTTISGTGFAIETRNTIANTSLEIVHDFLKNHYYIQLKFDYKGFVFDYHSKKTTHASIEFDDDDAIKLIQYNRSQEEQPYAQMLIEMGLSKTYNSFFELLSSSKNDSLNTLDWAIQNQNKLQEKGFDSHFVIDSKIISTQNSSIQTTTNLENDWFDVKMIIVCGDYKINFSEIVPNIKTNNRFYLLPNNRYFLIPQEWMTRYAGLAKWAKIENESLIISKANYTVLDEISAETANFAVDKNLIYTPSPLLKAQLRPYQTQGVQWLLSHYANGLGACLADDMGLGKTLQTLALLVAVHQELENKDTQNQPTDLFGNSLATTKKPLKALIVLPTSLVFNWYSEALKFTPHFKRLRYIGNDRKGLTRKLDNFDLIFTTYGVVANDSDVLKKHHFHYLILDESQYIKNKNSKTFKAINSLKADTKISLSGTPIENSLADLWSQMEFINPNILGSYTFFETNFKIPIEKYQDPSSLQELKSLVSPFILRRTKEQVLDDLPELTEQVYYCDMEPEQEKLYEQEKSMARNQLLQANATKDTLSIIQTLMRLRQLSNHPKMIDVDLDSGKFFAVTQYLTSLLQEGKKTIVFSSFVSNLAFYQEWCVQNKIDFCLLTGQTSSVERQNAVKTFQEDDSKLLFFISLKAGGVGLNITKASYVLFLDPWWNPFAEKQGIARAHRIGQQNKVTAVRFITKNTVEEKIMQLQERKLGLSDALLDDNYVHQSVTDNLDFILE